MNLAVLFSAGIFLLAFLSFLGVVFNILLNPIKRQISPIEDSQKELKDSHKEFRDSQRDLQDSHKELKDSHREIRAFQREFNIKIDKLLEKQAG